MRDNGIGFQPAIRISRSTVNKMLNQAKTMFADAYRAARVKHSSGPMETVPYRLLQRLPSCGWYCATRLGLVNCRKSA